MQTILAAKRCSDRTRIAQQPAESQHLQLLRFRGEPSIEQMDQAGAYGSTQASGVQAACQTHTKQLDLVQHSTSVAALAACSMNCPGSFSQPSVLQHIHSQPVE